MTDDDELQTAQDKAEAKAAVQLIHDTRAVMGTPEGRGFVWRLLGKAGIYHSSFSSDALAMAYNEGRRNFGLELMNRLTTYCPEQYAKMKPEQTENNEG